MNPTKNKQTFFSLSSDADIYADTNSDDDVESLLTDDELEALTPSLVTICYRYCQITYKCQNTYNCE